MAARPTHAQDSPPIRAHRPRRVAARRPRIGLALAGGGPLGGIYEVGALLALSDSLEGVDLNDIDCYVGVSSGGFIAASLANGISPTQMYRLFIASDATDPALTPEVFLKPALREYARRALSAPGLIARSLWKIASDPFEHGVAESFAVLGRAIPTGIFDNRAIDRFLTHLFTSSGRTNRFDRLAHRLFLVATDLDSGHTVTFGEPGHDHIPISLAVEASSALPGLFPPVEIDGHHYVDGALNKTLHASAAIDDGVQLLLCINPLVPFDAHQARERGHLTRERLTEGGLPLVLSQTFRAIIHSRMKVSLERYRRQRKDVDILLFEPHRGDADMFFVNIFSYAHRRRLCEAAFAKTREDLAARADELESTLSRYAITLNRRRLAESGRRIDHALSDPRPLFREPANLKQTARDLDHTLERLDRFLRSAH